MLAEALCSACSELPSPSLAEGLRSAEKDLPLSLSLSSSALHSGFGCLEGGAAAPILGLLDGVLVELRESADLIGGARGQSLCSHLQVLGALAQGNRRGFWMGSEA